MTREDFNSIADKELEYIRSLLIKKQGEYNLTEDRFDSFKRGAAISNWTPEQVLLGYQLKHLESIIAMINSKEQFTLERWTEKLTDAVNYDILLLGLVQDTGRAIKSDKENVNIFDGDNK